MRVKDYNPRDLMVEGNGFLQWLTVLAIAFDPTTTTLLLDEPDVHLHSTLQQELLTELTELNEVYGVHTGAKRTPIPGESGQ